MIRDNRKSREEKFGGTERCKAKIRACSAGECRQQDREEQTDKLEMTLPFCLVRRKLCVCPRPMLWTAFFGTKRETMERAHDIHFAGVEDARVQQRIHKDNNNFKKIQKS